MDNKNRKSGTGNITRGILPLAAGALGAGFLNGLLGAGAGIVLYFVLAAAGSRDAKENLLLSSTSVMFFCVISLFFYRDNAELTVESILRVGIPAALGGLCGAYLLTKIKTEAVKKLFAVVVIVGGVLMLI